MTQTYIQTLDAMGNPHMEPVGNGDWVRAADVDVALATVRDDTLREVKTAIYGIDLGFYDWLSGDWHAHSAEDVHFACLFAVPALIGQPGPPPDKS